MTRDGGEVTGLGKKHFSRLVYYRGQKVNESIII